MPSLTEQCKALEAFETDPWAIEAILDVELMTNSVIDPCCGTGLMANAAKARGHDVTTIDVRDWSHVFPDAARPDHVVDFLTTRPEGSGDGDWTCFLNPPFSKACEFIDRAKELGARKIVCFQRWAWRESDKRADWWAKNPPSRIWLCIDRATCWRFDIPRECVDPETCPRSGKNARCRRCMGNTTSAHAWYIWERGHAPAQVICDLKKPKPEKTA